MIDSPSLPFGQASSTSSVKSYGRKAAAALALITLVAAGPATAATPSADLAVVKVAAGPVTPGTNIVFTIVVTNNGPSSATATTVADPTPGGLTFVSNAGACVTAFPCSLGTLANGATRTITSTYSVPASYMAPNPVVNRATVSAAENDPAPGNNSSTATTPLSPSSDLSIIKTAPASIAPGSTATFNITVTNNGPSDAQVVKVTDATPSGLAFESNEGNCVTAYPCTLGTIPAGQTRAIVSTYSVPLSYEAPDPVVNTASVSATTPDPETSNDSSSATAPVIDPAADQDVGLMMTHNGTVETCGTAVFTLLVNNFGPDPTIGAITVTDELPAGLSFVSASGSGWGCSAAGQLVTCTTSTSIASGGASPAITLTVDVEETAFPTVINTASLHYDGDSHPVNDTDSNGVAVREGSCGPEADSCGVTLQKVHSGNDNPGGEIRYTLRWFNSCVHHHAVSFSDELPDELLLLSATSQDATASILDNTATFEIPLFSAGITGEAFITARIDPAAEPGTEIRNSVTLNDGAGHRDEATNVFHVRGGSADRARLQCALRAPANLTPGRNVRYDLGYRNGSADNDLTLTIPDDVVIDAIYPTPALRVGKTITWTGLAAATGKVSVNAFVTLAAEGESVLSSGATVDDGAGNFSVCEHVGVVSRPGRLFAAIKAQPISYPGAPIRYTVRYREVAGSNRMTLSLPEDVSVVRASPEPSDRSGNVLIWTDLPPSTGSVRVDGIVNDVPDGTVLVASVMMTDESDDVAGAERQTLVGAGALGTGTDGPLTLFLARSVKKGLNTDITLGYSGLQGPVTATLELPPELTPILAVPTTDISGNTVSWSSVSGSGSVKLRVNVDPEAASDAILTVRALVRDASGATATTQKTTQVRATAPVPPLSVALVLANAVAKGLTTDITADYGGLQGSGEITMTLPPEMTLQSSIPGGAQIFDNQVIWSGLTDTTGMVRARVMVSGGAVSGSTLPVSVSISDGIGGTSSAADTTLVR